MIRDETAIANLLYAYAERIDSGDLAGAAQLFAHAQIKVGDRLVDAQDLLAMWQRAIILYPDGTPRTKHIITNPIIEIDVSGARASCRSTYTVMQQADQAPLQAVICGRYHDEFQRVDGLWRFSWRDYSLHDLVGDLSRHSHNHNRKEE